MLTIHEIRLVNFRNIVDLRLNFETGMTGFLGENGKGKSSTFEGIYFLLTGEGFQNKQAMLNINSASGYVLGRFSIDDEMYTLERHLDITKVVLKGKSVLLKKATEVDEFFSAKMPNLKSIFTSIIFAPQGQMNALFESDPSTRMKLFQKIFVLPNTEKLKNVLWEKYITQLPAAEDYSGQRQQVQQAVDEIQAQLDLPCYNITTNDVDECRQAIVTLTATEIRLQDYARNKARLLALDTDLKSVRSRKLGPQQRIAELEQLVATYDEEAAVAEKYRLEDARKAMNIVQELQKQISATEDSLPGWTPEEEAELARVTAEVAVVGAEFKTVQAEVAKLQASISSSSLPGGTATCPTCGAFHENVASVLQHLEAELSTKHAEVKRLRQSMAGLTLTLANLQKKQASYAAESRELHRLQTQLTPYQDKGNFSEEEYTEVCGFLKEVQQTKGALQTAKTELVILEGREESLTREITTLTEEQTKLYATPVPRLNALLAEAKENLIIANARLTELISNLKLKERLVIEIKQHQRVLLSLEGKQEEALRVGEVRARLIECYQALHPTKLLKVLAAQYREILLSFIKSRLLEFSFPYDIQITEDFEFQALSNGKVLPVLSGGQKVIMGLCIRLSFFSMFADDFSLLMIDEGTTHLDKRHLGIYLDILQRLKESKRINQIFVIDHDERVGEIVDNIISY